MKRIFLTLAISGLLYGVSYATPGDGDDKEKSKKECKKDGKSCAGEKKDQKCSKGERSCCKGNKK
jgi:hypothetical protein